MPNSGRSKNISVSSKQKRAPAAVMQTLPWIYVGQQGKIKSTNPEMEKLLGYRKGSLGGMDFRELFCAEDRSRELPEAQSILTACQEEYAAWAILRRKDGSMLSASLVYKRLKPAGRPGARDLKEPFSSEMLIWVLASPRQAELEHLVGEYQARLDIFFNEHKRLCEGMMAQMEAPLTLIKSAAGALKHCLDELSPLERMEEIRRIESGVAACQQALEHAAQEWERAASAAQVPVKV